MENKTQTCLPLRVIARRHDEAIQTIDHNSHGGGLDCFVPRSDAKRCLFCCMWVLCLLLLFVACAPKVQESNDTVQGDNLMRYARNIVVYEKEYGYRAEVICPWDTTLSLGSFAFVKDTTKAVDKDVKGILNVPVNSVA